MKKILISLMAIALVVGLVGAGTMANFYDTETSTGNTFTAGTLNLILTDASDDGTESEAATWVFSDIAPGGSDGGARLTVTNAGTLPGYIDLSSVGVVNAENYDADTNEAEAADDADTSDATGGGELGANLAVVLFWDDGAGGGTAGNGIKDGSEATIYSGNLGGIAGNYEENYLLNGGATTYISMTWSIGTGVNNQIQGDSATLNITFELAQTAGQ